MRNGRSLYQCFHAKTKYNGKDKPVTIVCDLHKLSDKNILMGRMYDGAPLIYEACQGCWDYSHMGEQVKKEGRGLCKRGE